MDCVVLIIVASIREKHPPLSELKLRLLLSKLVPQGLVNILLPPYFALLSFWLSPALGPGFIRQQKQPGSGSLHQGWSREGCLFLSLLAFLKLTQLSFTI